MCVGEVGVQRADGQDLIGSGCQVNLRKLQQGLQFYGNGIQLLGQDLQLLVNMLTRAVSQGYTLRKREVP